MGVTPEDLPPSPRENANVLSKILFTWLIKLFYLGWKRDLELTDLYRVPSYDKSKYLGDELGRAWNLELMKSEKAAKCKTSYKPSLMKALIRAFGLYFGFLGVFAFIEECILKIAQPIFLGLLIRYFGGEFPQLNGNMGYIFASGLILAAWLYIFMHHPFFFETQHCGMRLRVACSSLVYRKALRLSQSALGKTTIGQMVNLLSNDVNRFDIGTGMVHYIWIGPIQLGIVIYILWGHFGWPCLVGVALLVLFVPFQSQMGRLFGSLRIQVATRTDKRVRIMNEIISAMRVIKMYTWEKPFAVLVAKSREDEIKYIKKTAVLRAINLALYYISSKIVIFLTLLAYVLTGNYLTAEKVFVTLSLYNSVRLIMTLFFPNGISQLAEIIVSVNRLQTFLLMEDKISHPDITLGLSENQKTHETEKFVRLTNLNASWGSEVEEPTLNNVSLYAKSKELVGVIGPVGAGKGSLLQVILKELPVTSGTLQVNGTIAYTSQEPWIFGGSVKDNIIFGKEFNSDRYAEVLKTCALERDLTLLPYGDNTLVGDRGTSLSGGQKARINLARAVYADADIYLLDDPLSAVDAEVGRHLFEKCIQEYLSNKVRILVTHQLQFLKSANQILLLDGGQVKAQGSYSDLLKTGINFAQLLKNEDNEQSNPEVISLSRSHSSQSLAKYKGTGMEVMSKHADLGFRRSASMSLLELGAMGNFMVPEEFECEDQDTFMISAEQSSSLRSRRRYKKTTKKKRDQTPTEKTSLIPKAQDEIRSSGDISAGLYWRYIRAGTSLISLVVLFFSNILVQVLFSGSDWWLQYWTKNEEARIPKFNTLNSTELEVYENMTNTSTTVSEATLVPMSDVLEDNTTSSTTLMDPERQLDVIVYSAIIGLLFIISLIRTAGFLNMCLNASINLHKRLFNGVLRAPMRFFEVNPVGRVLNRFAKDCGIIDETLPPTLFDTMDIALQFIGVIVIVCLVNPIMLAPSIILALVFYFVRRFYLYSARSVKRLEGVARSPVFSHLSTSLYGLTTIRAFKVEDTFIKQFDDHQDVHSSAWYLFLSSARWLGIFVDWCSVAFIAVVAFSFLLLSEDSAAVGLAISSALTLMGMFQWGVRQSAETENNMVSVERVFEYASLEPEAALKSSTGIKPPKSWPLKGQITMKNMTLRYGDEAPVLRNISCTFKSKDKVGIVGRTGAGKSSLIAALFRIQEPCEGTIEIDGIDVLKIGLHELRSKISIIPQDPVLFIGTLRYNLDPFNEYDDYQVWHVLEDVHLADAVREMPNALDIEIAEGGSNFSVGQRQLICLGRAILRKNKILILDEATANVDPETDALIQKTIRDKFSECTVLTVAHRLHTVMDSDAILVLDAGEIKEFDEPYKLLLNTNSALHQLVKQTGKATANSLLAVAKAVHDRKRNLSMSSVAEINESSSVSSIASVAEPDTADDVFGGQSDKN